MPRDLLAEPPSEPRDLLAEQSDRTPSVPRSGTNDTPWQAQPTPSLEQPSIIDRMQTNPVIGAPLQTALRGGQGVEQLLAHGAASASDVGGMAPNSLSAMLHAIADHVDASIKGQNQNYEQSGERVDAASPDPRLSRALRKTGEAAGNRSE